MFYTLSSRLLVPPNTIFVTDHTIGYYCWAFPPLRLHNQNTVGENGDFQYVRYYLAKDNTASYY